ncbi:hypothetical protein ACHHYP_16694 [Achlya hypogyna]|uniref:Uncharacterized protein n=1 Tax=Achlya hypogyna TaxID=1202772 RepID=A0A1V9Y602_ACHHY|nr:hypothetical protein ACHHYP_16694 [Achlya hypogyna]
MEGTAVLCFPGSGAWFQGYVNLADDAFIEDAVTSLGLFGVEVPVDDCVHCPYGGYREYTLTLINYKADKEINVNVHRTGGDCCALASEDGAPSVTFETSRLLVDADAAKAITKLFPSIAAAATTTEELEDCLVCYGTMHIKDLSVACMEIRR